MRHLWLVLALMLFGAPAVQAASFDCNKAATALEHAVCDNPELSEADDILAKTYATATGGLSDAALAAMRDGQRSWLSYAERACTQDAIPLTGRYTADDTNCLISLYTDRARTLEQSRMWNGRRIYLISRFSTIDDPDPEWYGTVAKKEFSLAVIDGDDAVAQAFNSFVGADSNDFYSIYNTPGETDDEATSDLTVTVSVESISTARITVAVGEAWYGHGAAHGNYGETYRHVLLGEKRALNADDIFGAADWQETMVKLVGDATKVAVPATEWDITEAVRTAATDPARWTFDGAGITVHYGQYEVASYAEGMPTVLIPWTALSGVISDTSFDAVGY